MIDGHTHLENGDLTIEYVQEFVNEAVKKGITTLHILDHTHRFKEFEFAYEKLKETPIQKEWLSKKFKNSLDDYMKLIEECRKIEFPIEVKFGLEVCYVEEYEEGLRELLSKYPFDYLIGSIHSINGLLYDMSFSKEILWDKYDVNDIYRDYYKSLFSLVKSNLFTQVGHPDTIKMFHYYPAYDLTDTYHEFADLCNEHHVLCENNTGCHYRYHHEDIGLSKEFLDILKEHHTAIITASDAHKPSDVGSCFTAIL